MSWVPESDIPHLAVRTVRLQERLVPGSVRFDKLCQRAWGITLSTFESSENTQFYYKASQNDGAGSIEHVVDATVDVNAEIGKLALHASILDADTDRSAKLELSSVHRKVYLNASDTTTLAASTSNDSHDVDEREMTSQLGHLDALATHQKRHFMLRFAGCETSEECVLEFNVPKESGMRIPSMIRAFEYVINELCTRPEATVKDLTLCSTQDQQQLGLWNLAERSDNVEQEHFLDIIAYFALNKPCLTAVDSWDGKLSYAELHELSSKLAVHLTESGLGVRQEKSDYIPILIEKSYKTVVAMIAVMKIGCPFVLMDSSQPPSRLQAIFGDLEPPLLICSPKTSELAMAMTTAIVCLENDLRNTTWLRNLSTSVVIGEQIADHVMYAVFTSGSTGKPKGISIERDAFFSCARAYVQKVGLNRHTRTLQFASYAFDVSISDTLNSLLVGGCLCIPSDSERSQHLAEAIRRLNPNWADLTPSLLRHLSVDDLHTISTVVVSGEALPRDVVSSWAGKIHLINVYGPAECSVQSTLRIDVSEDSASNIGHAIVGATWVVDPDNHESLRPIGAIGELLIEGPRLARGYLNNTTTTASSFIRAPKWLKALKQMDKRQDDHSNRLYCTGDLVQYQEDGSLKYIGRKDTQVKIRGQRVELEEIEHHIRNALSHGYAIAVEMISLAQGENKSSALVAFISPETRHDVESSHMPLVETPSTAIAELLPSVLDSLHCTLPEYMIPKFFLPISHLPLTASGKVDRRSLREAAAQLSRDDLKLYSDSDSDGKSTQSTQGTTSFDLYESIASAFAAVLNISMDSIGDNDDFFALGGDSITAMRAVALCRQENITLETGDILQYRTVSRIACAARVNLSSSASSISGGSESTWKDESNVPFGLSPIQSMFFADSPNGDNHFNQSMLLEATRAIDVSQLRLAAHAVVERHPMLRSRFSRSLDGSWTQKVTENIESSFTCVENFISNKIDVTEAMNKRQNCFDIEKGPIFSVDLIRVRGKTHPLLFINAHHAVIDLVSYRVILEDLEEHLNTGNLHNSYNLTSTSFHQWCQLEDEYALRTLTPDVVLPKPLHISKPFLDQYWSLKNSKNTYGKAITKPLVVDIGTTKAILSEANNAFGTEPVELLNAALLHSFMKIFGDREPPTIFNEGHGREPWSSNIDISRTVGWFTTIWPIQVDFEHYAVDSIADLVRRVKDSRRQVPGKGLPYFASRHLNPEGKESFGNQAMEIVFNFHGKFQQLEREGALFQQVKWEHEATADYGPDTVLPAIFEVTCVVVNDHLKFEFIYGKDLAHQELILQWVTTCAKSLDEIASRFSSSTSEGPTLVDLPLMKWGYSNMAYLEERMSDLGYPIAAIEDVYPCLPMQEGILLSRARKSSLYRTGSILELKSQGFQIDVNALCDAWQRVVERHSVLRTVIIPYSSETQQSYYSVVLKPGIQRLALSTVTYRAYEDQAVERASILDMLQKSRSPTSPLNNIVYQVKILASRNPKSVFCDIEFNHAIMDGWSSTILVQDWLNIYQSGVNLQEAMKYSNYVAYVLGKPSSLDYWRAYMERAKSCLFPNLSEEDDTPQAEIYNVEVELSQSEEDLAAFLKNCDTTLSSLFHVAWAVLLRSYIGRDDVCFGYLTSGRGAPISGVEHAVGLFANLLPFRINVSKGKQIRSLLQDAQLDLARSLSHENTSLMDILSCSNLNGESLFNTVVSIQYQKAAQCEMANTEKSQLIANELEESDPTEYDLALNVYLAGATSTAYISCWSSAIPKWKAEHISGLLSRIIKQIVASPQKSINAMTFLEDNHHTFLRQVVRKMPVAIDECVHDLIYRSICNEPMAIAISAWDRQLSYSDLDKESSRIAKLINSMGYGVGDWIPLLLQRSSWVPLAMLSVMKSGAAFVFLEATLPCTRLRQICADTNSTTIITTSSLHEKAETILNSVILVDKKDLFSSSTAEVSSTACSSPSDALYAIFTSGSTGNPKGVVIEHGAFASSALSHAPAAGYTSDSRVFQFSSYAFDACMVEIMTTLIVGGCVCIPSEHDRWNDLPGAVARFEANILFITPSMLRSLEPSLFPSLKTILVGGEALSAGDFQRWLGSATVVQIYGPTECSAYSTATEPLHSLSDVRNIGNTTGAITWIVDPQDTEILSPIGAVGELLLEGPIVGRGYLNRPEQTAAAFITPPTWRGSFESSSKSKFYRTGDLVQYVKDGTIRILGRKDSQVKLRGQRIELSEIEHSLHDILPDYQHICVELITSEGDNRSAMIVALVGKDSKEACARNKTYSEAESGKILQAIPESQRNDIEDAKMRLSERLPHYMNPSLFLVIKQLPLTAGGKADRRRLRSEAVYLVSQHHLETIRQTSKTMNESYLKPWERQLLDLVGTALGRPHGELTMQDDFFKVGGDSLRAMKLAQLARSQAIPISVQDIFQNSKLSSMAKHFHHHDADDSSRQLATCPLVPPFSLLNAHNKDEVIKEISASLNLDRKRIDDIYPCTPLQEGMMSLTMVNPDAYIMQRTHRLPSNCDLETLKNAWNYCIKMNPILRTRIIQTECGHSLQVVLSGEQEWLVGDDLQAYLNIDRGKGMGLKEPLLRIALISETINQQYPENRQHYVVLTMHHAIYDGWSEGLILDQVDRAYAGNSLTICQFAPFIKHLEEAREKAEIFWRNETRPIDTIPMSFPPAHAPGYQPAPSSVLDCSMDLEHGHNDSQATVSTQLRLAWAMCMRHFSASETVVFGVVANGRNAPMPGIEAITGPTIATLPFKVHFETSETVDQVLSNIQDKSTRMIPFEQLGLQNIRQLSASAAEECSFQSLLVVQSEPDQKPLEVSSSMDTPNQLKMAFDTYPLTLQCTIEDAHVEIQGIYDATIISDDMMQHVLDHFKHVFKEIAVNTHRPVNQIDSLSYNAKAQLTEWYNASQSHLLSSYQPVHELVKIQCELQPEALAISAWDGEFSYLRLDRLSSAFAAHLVQLGVGVGSTVSICYEKSKWLTVILLGVIKTGAAFVLLDTFSHPIHRMQLIVEDIKGEAIITSNQLLSTAEQLFTGQAIVVSEDSSFFLKESGLPTKLFPKVEDCTALYAIFTSGSTGKPKGVVIEHGGYVAGALSRQNVTGLNSHSRVLQFSSCSFDTFITDIFDTLIAGACICMPSETERRAGLASFARSMGITYADLVPSVARVLSPEEVPTLKILALSGEPMTPNDIARWGNKVQLCNLYGPAECSAVATAHAVSVSSPNASNIGHVCGGVSWVVSPISHDILLPIGAVGELLLEGPIVGRGYLGNVDERASSNFLQCPPAWRKEFPAAKSIGRIYKTGDLVQYQTDGTLLFIGRKDNQIKLHGQRLELGDVEKHLRHAFSKSLDAVATISSRGSSSEHLVAFIVLPKDKTIHNTSTQPKAIYEEQKPEDVQILDNEQFGSEIRAAEGLLRSSLPSFMVPTFFLPIQQLPRTPSGKVDRARLTHIASELINNEKMDSFTARRKICAPSTDTEKALQAIWAHVLDVEPSTIGIEDGFLQLGGDSIMAMKVASLAASRGFELSAPKLFQNKSLRSLAADAKTQNTAQPIDWTQETTLPASLQENVDGHVHASVKRSSPGFMREILLTGATGRLGRELLKQLVASPAVNKIHCVAVRQPEKLSSHRKIIPYRGDLSLLRLGMSEKEELIVLEKCDAIIHCGALVSFVQDYEMMREVNVDSTKYLAIMALKRHIPFHFISTVGVGHKDGDSSAVIDEVTAAPNMPSSDGRDGYTATKWASEVFLENINAQFSLPITIHRPSNIILDGDPEADIVNSLLVYSRRLGMVPRLCGWEGTFDFVSGAAAATNIIENVIAGLQFAKTDKALKRPVVQYIHESGETVFPVNNLATYLGQGEQEPLETVCQQYWVNKALEAGMRSSVGKFLMDIDGSGEKISMPLIKSRRRW